MGGIHNGMLSYPLYFTDDVTTVAALPLTAIGSVRRQSYKPIMLNIPVAGRED